MGDVVGRKIFRRKTHKAGMALVGLQLVNRGALAKSTDKESSISLSVAPGQGR
jgi:hypothetical protein